jgi:hypothetical protein
LKAARTDAKTLADGMKQTGVVQHAVTLLDAEVTYNRIEELFTRTLRDETRPGDHLLVFFAGHGVELGSSDGYCWVLGDSDTRNRKGTMVGEESLARWLRGLEGRTVSIILESSHAGAMDRFPGRFPDGRVRILAGCRIDEICLEDGEHGILTAQVLEYLRQSAGVFDLEEAYQFVKDRIPAAAKKLGQPEAEQHPLLFPPP